MNKKVKLTLWYGPERDRKSKSVTEYFQDQITLEDWIEKQLKKCKGYTVYYTIQDVREKKANG